MHKFICVAVAALLFVFPAAAHEHTHDGGAGAPFVLISSASKTLSAEDLAKAETEQTKGILSDDKKSLAYQSQTIRLVAHTGPEDDMLSYRIQGVRNPTLIVPEDAVLNVLFVNTDEDMPHDIHFGASQPPFPLAPVMEGMVGSSKLPHAENDKYSGEELSIRAVTIGSYTYFCSVRGHAKGGMYGIIAVGTAPAAMSTPTVMQGHEHDMHNMTMPGMAYDEHGDSMSGMKNNMAMRSTVDLNDPMSRESSGTSWMPDSSPIYARMRMKGDKMLMLHGTAFPRYTRVGGDRDVSIAGQGGRSRFDAPTMLMGMYSQPAGKNGQLGVRLMLSADPIIERGYGYPLLYQSGESYRGQPLHDRQHPHDLVSELSVTYSRRLGERNSAYLYLGYPGEPALGPPTFMHRLSAMDDPDAPISHHWQDSTHITWGVATTGCSTGRWKVEASAFKGEEPDENRYNFDSPRLDSFSGRLSWNPTANLALQVSHGYLKHPEALEPGVNLHRTTASVIYNKPLGDDANWSNALVWGQNDATGEGRTNSYLFETNYQRRANTFYARFERVQKSGHELVLLPPDEERIFNVGSYALGYVRDLKHNSGWDVGLGAQVTFNTNPSDLNVYYGGGSHTGFQIFLRIRPSRLR
jgi:rusticyanin